MPAQNSGKGGMGRLQFLPEIALPMRTTAEDVGGGGGKLYAPPPLSGPEVGEGEERLSGLLTSTGASITRIGLRVTITTSLPRAKQEL